MNFADLRWRGREILRGEAPTRFTGTDDRRRHERACGGWCGRGHSREMRQLGAPVGDGPRRRKRCRREEALQGPGRSTNWVRQ